MNPSRNQTLIVTVVVLLALTGGVRAVDKNAPTVVTCELRVIEAPRADVNKLVANTAYVMKPETLRQLQELVDQKKATILAQPRVTTVSGAQAQVRAVRELIYPSDYQSTVATVTKTTAGTNVVSETTSRSASNPAVLCPADFKTREIGVLLNLTPTVDETGTWINLTLIPELSQLSSNRVTVHRTSTPSGPSEIALPEIDTWNATTSVVLKSGSTVLLAVHEPVKNDSWLGHDTVRLMLLSAAVNHAE